MRKEGKEKGNDEEGEQGRGWGRQGETDENNKIRRVKKRA